jgi:hypothetical protein
MRTGFVICLGMLLLPGCGGHPSGQAGSSGAPATSIKLDGSIDKWHSRTPAWDGGLAAADQTPFDVHIMKVYFYNDSHYFYAFIQCSPTIQERSKVSQMSGVVGQIFVDGDDNPDTGCPTMGGDDPKYRGYKIRVWLPIGIYVGMSGSGTFVSYDLYRFSGDHLDDNNGFNAEIAGSNQNSNVSGSLIADGKDGVEMAIPMEMLGLKPGGKARIMIQEGWDPQGRVGFATYQCR